MSGAARRATIIDVAERAGVSRQTVSRAMNDQPGISAATRERVLRAARDLSYRPSRFGRGLVEQGPVTLGLVVLDLSNSYFAELGAAMAQACAPVGWNMVLVEVGNTPDPEVAAAELARRVDALVGYGVLGGGISGGVGMPVVRLDGRAGEVDRGGVVELAPAPAITQLADHLREVGVCRPLVLDIAGGPIGDRPRALADALGPLHEDGEVPVWAVEARRGHRAVLEEALGTGADVLLAFNDELAVRLLRTLREMGVEVPGDIRLVGADGLEIGTLVSPELTTLSIDIAEVARQTVSLVAAMLEGDAPLTGAGAHRVVPYQLEVRGSA